MDVTLEVDFGEDTGQNFGTLFEATDSQGRVVAGAGFLGLYNTMFRADRRTLHAFVRPPEESETMPFERLPRYSADNGIYVGDMEGRLCALAQREERRLHFWDPKTHQWEIAPPFAGTPLRNGDGRMALGNGILTFINNQADFNGTPILTPPTEGSYHHFYYALGHLFFYHDRPAPAGSPARIYACPWKPGQGPINLEQAKVQVLTVPNETTWAFGQLPGCVLTVTNQGGVHRFDGKEWKTLRQPDGTSYQVYSMLNYADRLLLGHYPSGCLYEFDGEQVKPMENFPPRMPGVVGYAREAQSTTLYRGDLYVGVWPWGEVWRYDRNASQWLFVGRTFTRPAPTEQVGHPFEAEIKAYNAEHGTNIVFNEWGQRVTSLAVVGDSLYIGTGNKGGIAPHPGFTFLTPEVLREYGQVLRLRMPGHLTGPVKWTQGPTRFRFLIRQGRLHLFQDGHEIAATAIPPSFVAGLRGAHITWGKGVFGPLMGTLRQRTARLP